MPADPLEPYRELIAAAEAGQLPIEDIALKPGHTVNDPDRFVRACSFDQYSPLAKTHPYWRPIAQEALADLQRMQEWWDRVRAGTPELSLKLTEGEQTGILF